MPSICIIQFYHHLLQRHPNFNPLLPQAYFQFLSPTAHTSHLSILISFFSLWLKTQEGYCLSLDFFLFYLFFLLIILLKITQNETTQLLQELYHSYILKALHNSMEDMIFYWTGRLNKGYRYVIKFE